MKTKALFFLAAIIVGIAFTQCRKDDDEIAPDLPPESSMITDFSSFTSGTKDIDTAQYSNWGYSAVVVTWWSGVLYTNLAVPVAAFTNSFNQTPVQQTDGSWTWTTNYAWFGDNVTSNLNGKVVSNGVDWKMYLTYDAAVNGYTDFLWFEGFSNTDNTSGTWTMNYSPAYNVAYLGIEWNRAADNSTGDIKYEIIDASNAENGAYIEYGLTTDTPYNIYYDLYGASTNNLTEIEWNNATYDGRVIDPNYFGDNSWHCWDSYLEDLATCP